MSKFGCKCGHVIGFNVFPCRYEGEVMRDTGSEAVYTAATEQVADFIAAIQAGNRTEWLRQFYGSEFEIADDEAVYDILTNHLSPSTLVVHQCERCGRLWLQHGPVTNKWDPYLPEGDWRGALETPTEGFVGYLAGQDLFGSRIVAVRREEATAWVELVGDTGTVRRLTFTGVAAVRLHEGATDKPIRFLGEWSDAAPLRRFVFDSADQKSEPLVEITATEVNV